MTHASGPATAPASSSLAPPEIFATLKRRVIGQDPALRDTAVALSKHLLGQAASNLLLIGGSGSGKTTILRAIEELLRADPRLAGQTPVLRMNANLLAELASQGQQSAAVLDRLASEAGALLGPGADTDSLREAVERGLVFIDEIDKIRSHVGDRPHIPGIVAQESLLTLMEGEKKELRVTLPGQQEPSRMVVDTRGILFVAAGAFDELYEQVLGRVSQHEKHKIFKLVTRADGTTQRLMHFELGKHLQHADLFQYGIAPQLLARFAGVVALRDLAANDLVTIFRDLPDAPYRGARAYFEGHGLGLRVTDEAITYIAEQASLQPRLGARALREVFGRVIREVEYDPWSSGLLRPVPAGGQEVVVDLEAVKRALDR